MAQRSVLQSSAGERGTRVALIYTLLAETLHAYFEQGRWLTVAEGATLCADWLGRSGRSLPSGERKQLSGLADTLARSIAASLSREAGLYAAHELMESLDPRYESDFGATLIKECERVWDEAQAG